MSEIRIPFSDPIEWDDSITDVIEAIRKSPELDDEERDVARAIAFTAPERGIVTAAELAKELEGADARAVVDEARTSLDLPTLAEEDAHKEFERANANLPPGRDAEGRCLQKCAARGCVAYPLNEMGVPVPVPDRIWWCDAHKHLADPDDHLPPAARYRLDLSTMGLVAVGEERERLLEENRERERKAAEREQRRREEAKALAEVESRYMEQAEPIAIAGWLVRPNGVVVDDR